MGSSSKRRMTAEKRAREQRLQERVRSGIRCDGA